MWWHSRHGGRRGSGPKRARKTKQVFEVPQERQTGRRDYVRPKAAPLSVSQATPQHPEGLVPIDDFLGDSLFALEQLLAWSDRMRAGAAPSPALPDSNAPSCGEDGVLVLDRVRDALQATWAARVALPQFAAAGDSMSGGNRAGQPVQYFVSRATYGQLCAAVGRDSQGCPTSASRKPSKAALLQRANDMLRALVPTTIGSLPILWTGAVLDDDGGTAPCAAAQPHTPVCEGATSRTPFAVASHRRVSAYHIIYRLRLTWKYLQTNHHKYLFKIIYKSL